ncbi:hydrogenase maturation protease [Candidatus Micrarchaeota archaeon]|nr:hydrogenase maturation protease [Candidatus Micrarchaeota archaeon]MBU1165479.1 hydrogenase maturation protease [Candidatus Micrarchaeota archaeon]MBU1886317.1 hydrogenase maturation protease [Candidatus Micrarchaeota archaeon]
MYWKQKLKETVVGKRILILCVGNELKADDGLGKYVFDRLATKDKIYCGEMPENFIGVIKKREPQPEVIMIIDAVDFNATPGEIVFAGVDEFEKQSLSTHSLSFTIMKKMFDDRKIEIVVLGVQPKSLEFGHNMNNEISESVDILIKELNKEL